MFSLTIVPYFFPTKKKHTWPSTERLDACVRKKYHPSLWKLKPGQFVHINKGRLHAYRRLPATSNGADDPVAPCVDIRWVWMYRGITAKGIHEEVGFSLQSSLLSKLSSRPPLGVPGSYVFEMARTLSSPWLKDDSGLHSVNQLAEPPPIPGNCVEVFCHH